MNKTKKTGSNNLFLTANKQFCDRINFIYDVVCNSFEMGPIFWWFPNADEGEIGSFEAEDGCLMFETTADHSIVINYNGREIDLSKRIPMEWLFQDFEIISKPMVKLL